MTKPERRRAARTPARLAMEVRLGGKDYGRLETINVSANGVYFSSPAFIAPLTRLEIVLLIPAAPGGSGGQREVTCEGVVVRTEPELEAKEHSQYEVACFFTAIDPSDRAHLESYILAQISF